MRERSSNDSENQRGKVIEFHSISVILYIKEDFNALCGDDKEQQ